MKIFDINPDGWGNKVNFVDENNVLVGYDLDQNCCERAYWVFTDAVLDIVPKEDKENLYPDLENYVFDTSFFLESKDINLSGHEDEWCPLDGGGMVIFRLVNPRGEEKFLYLINCHNGYYSHGFVFSDDNITLQEGSI